MIVPRSTVLISQDNEYGLFSVSLFKKVVEEFKLHSREKKFVVRDFTYNEEVLAAGKNEITKLVTDKKKQFVCAWFLCLFAWCCSLFWFVVFFVGSISSMVKSEL